MKLKYALISILFILTLSLTASQIGLVNAVSSTTHATSPLTGPIPSPTSTPTPTPYPITPPVPSPTPIQVIRYSVTGLVNHKATISNPSTPMKNVTIKAVNQSTQKITLTKTDTSGKYYMLLNKDESYVISASDAVQTVFLPLKRTVRMTKPLSQQNFQGQ